MSNINVTINPLQIIPSDYHWIKFREEYSIELQKEREQNTFIIDQSELLDFFTDSKYGYQYCSYFIKKLDNGKLEIVRGYFTEDGLEARYLEQR
jgi:hypothetical protein